MCVSIYYNMDVFVVLSLCIHEPEYAEVVKAFKNYEQAKKYVDDNYNLNLDWDIETDDETYFTAFSPSHEFAVFIQNVDLV